MRILWFIQNTLLWFFQKTQSTAVLEAKHTSQLVDNKTHYIGFVSFCLYWEVMKQRDDGNIKWGAKDKTSGSQRWRLTEGFWQRVVCFMLTEIIVTTYSVFAMWLLLARLGLYAPKLSTWKVAPGRSEVQGQPCSRTKLLGIHEILLQTQTNQ